MRAIISVYDKNGVVDFARGLSELGVEILSTGGTQTAIADAGVPVTSVSDLTGFPEILGGRVKTLHPYIYGGILARRSDPQHMEELTKHNIQPVDIVAVNLYPFAKTARRADASLAETLEMIDIGGPTLLRAAAKNYQDVLVLVDPADYMPLLEELKAGTVSDVTRRKLAVKAFEHTAFYDAQIANYLRPESLLFPQELTVPLKKMADLRYGENPHQSAAFYLDASTQKLPTGVATATQLNGKQLSFNNSYDLDSAWAIVTDFTAPTVTIVKHGNPCGLACAGTVKDAFRHALATDPKAAYGGAVGVNRVVDEDAAQEMSQVFFEDMIAPGYTDRALEILKGRHNLRIMAVGEDWEANRKLMTGGVPALDFKRVLGGFLVQERDMDGRSAFERSVVTNREPNLEELTDLLFAWHAVKHVRSNAIVLARKLSLVGIGAGQMSRVDSVELSIKKAAERIKGSVMASDAYFPFPDSIEVASDAGITAVIQPGGSVRDQEVIKAANAARIAMIFTGRRHFKH